MQTTPVWRMNYIISDFLIILIIRKYSVTFIVRLGCFQLDMVETD